MINNGCISGFFCFLLASFLVTSSLEAGTWSSEEAVCPDSTVQLTSDCSHWCIGVDGFGVVHVVWEDWDEGIRYNRRTPDEGWSSSCFAVSQGMDPAYMENASICNDASGNLFVAWSERRFPSGIDQIYYRRYTRAWGWDTTDTRLDNPTDRNCYLSLIHI